MTNRRIRAVVVIAGLLLMMGSGVGADEPSDEEAASGIAWHDDLTKAFETAKAEKKVVMICINVRMTEEGKVEPAARGLREVVYRDPSVVEKARQFVCVLLTAEGSSADYDGLRARFGLSGKIVSPQHIFAAPDHAEGAEPLARKQYWPFGKGQTAVKMLLALMDKALAAYGPQPGAPPPKKRPTPKPTLVEGPPAAGGRAVWIQETVALVRSVVREKRRAAVRALARYDKDGDCVDPVLTLVSEFAEEKKLSHLVDVLRELGVPKLERALPMLHDMLKHKDDSIRAEAAVSLEYVGSPESVAVLSKRVNREKSEAIANHMYRALGRCGAGESKVKQLLLRNAQVGKSPFAAYGPIIGLSYFEGDAKLARVLEKELLKWGQPFGGGKGSRGGTFMRAILIWCLSEVADPKTAPFLRKRYIEPLENIESRWRDEVFAYFDAAARKCEGDKSDEVRAAIARGIGRYVGWDRFAPDLRDEHRRDRNTANWAPKGEWEPIRDRDGG